VDELRDLYQEVILDHNKNPRNFHKMENANRVIEGQNPLCGDHYTIYLIVEDGIIKDISYEGAGCAISKASASMMSSALKGKSVSEAEKVYDIFHKIVTGEEDATQHLVELGKLAAFAGVAEFPIRVKCATLAWHAMHSGLQGEGGVITTESE
jgi:nitrogen fixation NifU-like protein